MLNADRVYLDYNATTPLAPEALEAMLPFLSEHFGNPSSIHGFGRPAKEALIESTDAFASFLGARPEELVFTSGGTEADNLALLGAVAARRDDGRRHIVTSNVEHHAVLQVIEELERRDWPVTIVEVDERGELTPDRLRGALREDTLLVSIMVANNETGVVQPVGELTTVAHDAGALFHTDAVQACGKIPLDVRELGVDMLAISGHKFYGPRGVGALYVRKGTPFEPVFRGGGQERGRRPGTENVAGIVGLAEAARQVDKLLPTESKRLATYRDALERSVLSSISKSHVNGEGAARRTPNTVNFRFDSLDGEALVLALDEAGYAVSAGAACDEGAVKPSHVLAGLGLSTKQIRGSIRVSLGRYTREEDIEVFAQVLRDTVTDLREGKIVTRV